MLFFLGSMDCKTGIWAWSCSGFGLSMRWAMAWPVFFYFCLIKKRKHGGKNAVWHSGVLFNNVLWGSGKLPV
jgi:hypothetical protein